MEAVINARSKAVLAREELQKAGGPTGDGSLKGVVQAEAALKSTLGNFFALAENYPDLKSSQNMKSLQEELASTENRIAFSRQSYNDVAMAYNTYQQEFPNLMFASPFGHHPVDLYNVENEEAKKAVKVQF
jgi:LemA protein